MSSFRRVALKTKHGRIPTWRAEFIDEVRQQYRMRTLFPKGDPRYCVSSDTERADAPLRGAWRKAAARKNPNKRQAVHRAQELQEELSAAVSNRLGAPTTVRASPTWRRLTPGSSHAGRQQRRNDSWPQTHRRWRSEPLDRAPGQSSAGERDPFAFAQVGDPVPREGALDPDDDPPCETGRSPSGATPAKRAPIGGGASPRPGRGRRGTVISRADRCRSRTL